MTLTILPAPGTVTVTYGDATITGDGTTFTIYKAGYLFSLPGVGGGIIKTDPTSDTELELVTAWGGHYSGGAGV